MSGQTHAARSVWLAARSGPLAVRLHLPATLPVRPQTAVCICPPFGHEYTHAHRTLRTLADRLAQAGYPAVRFDYSGTGDSFLDPSAPGGLTRRQEDVEDVLAWMREREWSPVLLGVRLGALLAARAAAVSRVHRLVLWAPVLRGKLHARELRALALTGPSPPGEDGSLEAGGFPFPADLVSDLKSADMADTALSEGSHVLILERDDLPGESLGPDAFKRAAHVEVGTARGFAEMLAEPQETVVPHDVVDRIVEWVGAGGVPDPGAAVDVPREMGPIATGPHFQEEFVEIGDAPVLYGVLTSPASAADGPVVVLPNSGSVHRVGPNRAYVDFARRWAEVGISTLRFDLRNLGDSVIGGASEENHPYPLTAQADVEAVLDWVAERRPGAAIVLSGICSAAHSAFHVGLESECPELTAVLPMNPLTFYWEPGMSLAIPAAERNAREAAYYRAALRDPARWGRVLRGKVDYGYFVGFVGPWLARGVARVAHGVLQALGLERPPRLARDLEAILARGRRIGFVFSGSDPGFGLLTVGAGRTAKRLSAAGKLPVHFIQDADHTFSAKRWRVAAADALVEQLDRWGEIGR